MRNPLINLLAEGLGQDSWSEALSFGFDLAIVAETYWHNTAVKDTLGITWGLSKPPSLLIMRAMAEESWVNQGDYNYQHPSWLEIFFLIDSGVVTEDEAVRAAEILHRYVNLLEKNGKGY